MITLVGHAALLVLGVAGARWAFLWAMKRRRLGRALPQAVIVSRTFTPVPGLSPDAAQRARDRARRSRLNLDVTPCEVSSCGQSSVSGKNESSNDASGAGASSASRTPSSRASFVGGVRPSGTSLALSRSRVSSARLWKRKGD